MKHKPRGSIHPGVSQQGKHTELCFSFQRGNVQSINIWSLLIERICAASILGGSFKHCTHMDSLYSYLSLCSLVPSEMSCGHGKQRQTQTRIQGHRHTHTQVRFWSATGILCLIVGCFPSEELLFCFAISGAWSCFPEQQAWDTQCERGCAFTQANASCPPGEEEQTALKCNWKNVFACHCVCIQN